jgi:hypothetical protein
MPTLELSWETWRDIIAALYATGDPALCKQATVLEERLARQSPWRATVALALSEDASRRALKFARWELDLPWPPTGRSHRLRRDGRQRSQDRDALAV